MPKETRTRGRAASRTALGFAPPMVFLALGTAYALAVPMFEKPDETRHLEYVRFLARERRLPCPLAVPPYHEETHWQGAHAPLPHAVVAAVLLILDPLGRAGIASDRTLGLVRPMPDAMPPAPVTWPRLNPRAFLPSDWDVNRFERDERDRFPLRYPYTVLRGLRLASLAWGLGTVWLAGLTASLALGPGPWAILSALLTALHPQHAFMASAVSNDGPSAFLGALVAWLGLRHVRAGERGWPRARAVGLGAAVGLGMLARVAVGTTGLFAAACVWLAAGRSRRALSGLGLLAVGAAVTAGWWFVRNQVLTGDPLGWHLYLAANASFVSPRALWSPYFFAMAERGFVRLSFASFWAGFGWFTIFLPRVVYALLWGVCLGGAAGVVLAILRRGGAGPRPDRIPLSLLALHAAATLALIVWFNLRIPEPQGRYFFPSLAPLMILLAAGLRELGPRARWLAWGALAVLIVANADAFLIFARIYR